MTEEEEMKVRQQVSPEEFLTSENNWLSKCQLKQLLFNISIFGFCLDKRVRHWYTIMMLALFLLFVVYYFCFLYSVYPFYDSVVSLIAFLAYWSEVLIAFIVYVYSVYYKTCINNNMKSLFKLSEANGIGNKGKNSLLIKIFLTWFVGFIMSFCQLFIGLERFAHCSFCGIKVNRYEILIAIGAFGYALFGVIFLYLNLLLFINICRVIGANFNCLCSKVAVRELTEHKLYEIIKTHTGLCELTKSFEGLYSPLLFVWILNVGVKLIFLANDVVHNRSNYTSISFSTFIFLWASSQVYLLISVCISASCITEQAENFSAVIYTKTLTCKTQSDKDVAFQFYVRCLHELPKFTGWKMFVLNRSFVLTIFGVAFSYLIIIYQIDSK